MKEGLKPSLATTHAEASRRVIADPSGLEHGLGRPRETSENHRWSSVTEVKVRMVGGRPDSLRGTA